MENQKSAEHWPKIDLLEGEVKTYFSLSKNDIYTQQYNFNLTVFFSILYSFINPASLILISTCIVVIVLPEASPYSLAMYSVQLILIVLTSIVKGMLINKTKEQADSRINKKTAKVFRGAEQFDKMQWGQIQQGDIVYLVQGQTAPADLIILDSQQIQHREAFTYVDVKSLYGESVCQKKKACYLTQLLNRSSTQKRVWQQYRKILSGRITYQKPSASMNSFTGYLKLAKDPKVQKLSIQNLVLRESTIKTSLWIYGLVIYAGMDSKVMKSFKQGNKSRQHILSEYDKKFFANLLAVIILGNVFTMLYIFTGVRYQNRHFIVAYHFLMFSILIPNLLYLARDLFLILIKFTNKNSDIQIRDFSNLQQLGEITHAVMSNVGVLTTGKLQVNQIVTESSIYAFDTEDTVALTKDTKLNSGLHKRRVGSSLRCDNPQGTKQIQNKFLLPIMNYDKRSSALVFKQQDGFLEDQNFEIDDDTNVRLKQSPVNSPKNSKLNAHLEPLKLDKNRFYNYVKRNQNQSTDIIKAFGLCHQAKFHYDSAKDKYQGISNVNSEQVLLKLANYVGWNMMPKMIDKKQVGVTIFQQKQKMDDEKGLFTFETVKTTYYWTGINLFHIPRKLFSVVVSNDGTNTLYCKGKPEDMLERLKLSKQTQKIIEQTIASYNKKQSEILIYAKRDLSSEERQIYENDYVSLKSSLTTSEKQIDQFSKKYEKNLQFICIIGMSTQINSEAASLIKYIRSAGIKPCIFVNQKSETTSMKKLTMEQTQIYKDIELEGESAQLIKYYLNQATNLFSNNNQLKFTLSISGKAWQVIRSNSQVMQHFMLVLNYAEALIAIKFTSEYIGELTHKIRSSYPDKNTVLGIGYSYDDLKFLGESNVSISTCPDLPTDIKVESLNKIIDVLKIGPYLLMIKLVKTNIIQYRIITISTVVFLYQIIMSSYANSQTMNGHLVFFYLIIYTLLQLAYNLYNFRTPSKLQDSTKYKYFRTAQKRFYVDYLQAFIHGTVILLSLYFNLSAAKYKQIKILPIQSMDLAVFISLVFTGCFRNLFNNNFTKIRFIVTSLITLVVMSFCLYLTSLSNTKFKKVYEQAYILFYGYDSVTAIINCIIFCLAVSLFLQQIVKKKLLNEKTSVKKTQKDKREAKKKMIQIIKHLYKQESNMQFSVEQIVSSEMDVDELKINKFLAIKNEQEDIKFLSQRIFKNKNCMIKFSAVMGVLFLIILIVDITVFEKGFKADQLSCIFGFVLCITAAVWFSCKGQVCIRIYYFMAGYVAVCSALLLSYTFASNQSHDFLAICLLAFAITQNININFFMLIFIMLTIIISGIVVSSINSDTPIANKVIYPLLQITCLLYNFYLFYEVELSTRIIFVKTQTFQKQSNYVNGILSILVPKFIKNHLQGNQFALQQQQKKVSILFCYVCNFDQIVREQGKNVVSLMDQLFRQFDQLCHNYAVQKIETVGQTYMAATGIQAYEDQIQSQMKKKNQVERLLKMAIQMLDKSKDIMWGIKKNKRINLKIGIHHGNVMIGVIGYHKPQFSLIGDAVNTTSRHCSTASPGQIVVSYVAYELLRKFPASAFTKSTKTMKGLGEVPVYKYNNNIRKEQSHFRLRIKFQNVVKKVIQNLKVENKINYKKFKASQIAAKVMLRQRLSTKRMTKISQPRKSLADFDGMIPLQNLLPQVPKQNKYNDMCLKYDKFMELTQKNSQYKKHLISKHLKSDRLKLILLASVYLISYLVDLLTNIYTTESLALSSIGIVLFPIMFILYKQSIKHRSFNIAYIVLHSYLILIVNLSSILLPNRHGDQYILAHAGDYYGIMAVAVCSSQKAFRFIHTVILAVVSTIVSVTIIGVDQKFDLSIIYQIFCLVLILIRKYNYIHESYQSYNHAQIYEKKTQQQSALVSQLLPKHAYEKLKNQNIQNKLQLTDRFECATILFADIKGFTSYSNKNTPAGVVKMLRELFQQFDKLCLKFNVYKVYTIGDCYVVLGFTNCYQRDYLQQAKNVVNMGLAMVETIQRVRQALDFEQLDMRIGIHTGTIIGGIIGTQIVRYDIYGPDVMVANKFQEYGKTGNIHISEATKQILDQDKKKSFNIVPHGVVRVEKLNAEYNGYILTKKKFQL